MISLEQAQERAQQTQQKGLLVITANYGGHSYDYCYHCFTSGVSFHAIGFSVTTANSYGHYQCAGCGRLIPDETTGWEVVHYRQGQHASWRNFETLDEAQQVAWNIALEHRECVQIWNCEDRRVSSTISR